MRTTIEIEDQLYAEIKRRSQSSSRTVREVVEAALRSVFMNKKQRTKPFSVRPHSSAFRAGIDEDRLRKYIDDIDLEEKLRQARLE